MDDVLTQEVLDGLTEEFQCKESTILKIYRELITKKCVIEDASEERLLNCLYEVLLDKSMTTSQAKSIRDGEPYFTTNDYYINKALLNQYEDRAIPDLSEAFIAHDTGTIDMYKDKSIKEDSHSL